MDPVLSKPLSTSPVSRLGLSISYHSKDVSSRCLKTTLLPSWSNVLPVSLVRLAGYNSAGLNFFLTTTSPLFNQTNDIDVRRAYDPHLRGSPRLVTTFYLPQRIASIEAVWYQLRDRAYAYHICSSLSSHLSICATHLLPRYSHGLLSFIPQLSSLRQYN